ncbi:hypothetical protein K470DRAFT_292931 [Piedraia hortae CBS 480.64]|uniref:Uncharacterized protein n=1 Tax=Piedraia hortae CBS 480.64 TaxID=1314780 RepID=A0A6A7C696_9PEZI|nr:hypothetical protein K470DRAFT_292931 [Piedraia hortae CBS 480.64]
MAPLGPYSSHMYAREQKTNRTKIQEGLKDSCEHAFRSNPINYTHATAIMIPFDNDDLGVASLENERASTLRLQLDCQAYDPMFNMMGITKRLSAAGSSDKGYLVILAYSGHSGLVRETLHVGGAIDPKTVNFDGHTLSWHDMT